MASLLKASRYNFAIEDANGNTALFNGRTGALVRLEGHDVKAISSHLVQMNAVYQADMFDDQTAKDLIAGGFLIDENHDELQEIRERFWKARGATPPILTITTTMDCNLGCYYCYEERSQKSLSTNHIRDLVRLAKSMVSKSPLNSLHVDWYGGEPLLNLEFLEQASTALISLASQMGIRYSASIISNGTVWPNNICDFVARHRVTQVQISFDGMKANHDKRRRYRRPFFAEGVSSFDAAVAVVDELVQVVRVDLRYNLDRGNICDVDHFVDFAEARGWFYAQHPAILQPARLASYSNKSRFMESHQLTLEEFDACRVRLRRRMAGTGTIEESEVPDGYPYPRTSVCAALANHSHVVGGDASTYRCGLQVGEPSREVGHIADPAMSSKDDTIWWQQFDPTIAVTCSVCSFLPVCWGGCPKKHLEGDRRALDEQGRYWRTNLPRLIAKQAGFEVASFEEVPVSLQFR
jgi:uncharacterized protein